jgi:hypothetical protein
MKTKITIIALLISITGFSQFKAGEVSYRQINIITDPYAMIQESGLYIGGEYEHIEDLLYVKAGLEFFPALEGGYNSLTLGGGLNLKYGYFDDWRYYTGFKFALVNRGKELYINPAVEGGIAYMFDSGTSVGLRADCMYRQDFLWSGANADIQFSGFILLSFKLN